MKELPKTKYHESGIKSSIEQKQTAKTKAEEAKKLKRSAAIIAFIVPELLRHFNLVHKNNYICPKCKDSSINGDKHSFYCSNCKTKGNTIKLAKLALNSTDWGEIKYIEELVLSKSNADKPTDVIEVVSSNEVIYLLLNYGIKRLYFDLGNDAKIAPENRYSHHLPHSNHKDILERSIYAQEESCVK